MTPYSELTLDTGAKLVLPSTGLLIDDIQADIIREIDAHRDEILANVQIRPFWRAVAAYFWPAFIAVLPMAMRMGYRVLLRHVGGMTIDDIIRRLVSDKALIDANANESQ